MLHHAMLDYTILMQINRNPIHHRRRSCQVLQLARIPTRIHCRDSRHIGDREESWRSRRLVGDVRGVEVELFEDFFG